MELVFTVIFILCIAFWAGYRGVARTVGDSELRYVLKHNHYAVLMGIVMAVTLLLINISNWHSFTPERTSALTIACVRVMVLALLSCIRLSTSAVTVFWGAMLALEYHQGSASHIIAAMLLSLLAIPLFSYSMTWVFNYIFKRHVFNREEHLLLKLLQTRRIALIGVLVTTITLSVNCSLLFDTLLASSLTGIILTYKWLIISVTLITCIIGIMKWRPGEEDSTHSMPQRLPSLYALAVSLLVSNILAFIMLPTSVPVIVSVNQIKTSNNLVVYKSSTTRHIIDLLSITLLTPLLAFCLCLFILSIIQSVMITIALSVFTLFASLMVYLNYYQYKKHRQTKSELYDELVHKSEVREELNRMDLAAVTSQFDVMTKEIDLKHKELINLSLYIKQQRQYLEDLGQRLDDLSRESDAEIMSKKIREESARLSESIKLSNEMDQFYMHVEEMHKNFVSRLQMRCPNLSEREKRLAILLRLGFSSKEIAHFMNVEPKSVEINRYRFRRKLKLDRSVNIVQYLQLL